MLPKWLHSMRRYLLWTGAVLIATAGVSRAGDNDAELRALIEAQGKQIQELRQKLESQNVQRTAADDKADTAPKMDENAVKNIVGQYLKDNPGAGMPASVQTGYSSSPGAGGFAIRSVDDPRYVKWEDECKIPFELRIRGRLQFDYYNYKVTDSLNHESGRLANPVGPATSDIGLNDRPDFSQLEVKRARLYFEGTVFDPNLRYRMVLDGNTRGLAGLANGNGNTPTVPSLATGMSVSGPFGGDGIATVDHAVRLFEAWVAYDFHPCGISKGCAPDCPEGSVRYGPTVTAIIGKAKPMMGLEEYLGSGTEQFVEYSMADWFFDADDDNLLMVAGFQFKALEDRLFALAYVTNGNETQIANSLMDHLPGINLGGWYDFGGEWDATRQRWNLFGDSLSDIDYSCRPVVRVGSAAYIAPMDRRTQYSDAELNRAFVAPGGPGGTRMLGILGGGLGTATPPFNAPLQLTYSADKFDSYTLDTFIAGKYKGFSLYNEWWARELNDFQAVGRGNTPILYRDGSGANAIFPVRNVVDYGTTVQAGYFVLPKKLELVSRYSWIRGESGDIDGSGKILKTIAVPGAGNVRIIDGAFRHFHESTEYAVGVNYFFRRELVKWQTDIGLYQGGNPAGNGASAAGFIPGVDGYMIRSQIQLAF